ncbi:neprosin family prolyl endopeptidase [Ideonella sp. YS5]|uniref:neprosin family prolyl endopeptidase n=1 Tax=Ideonella sp. YS5 TaxID=3453714 RepID=UPI003EE85B7B
MYRMTLIATLVAATLPALAEAAPTLTQSLAQMDAEQAADYLGRPGAKVRDTAEFQRMKDYVRQHYDGVVALHHFELSPGQVFDCVDELTQPGARRLGLTRADWQRKPSQGPVDADADTQLAPAMDRHGRDPGIFLKPAAAGAAEVDAEGQAKACAKGTIPMQRLTLSRLAAFESLDHFRHKRGLPGTGGLPGEGMQMPEATVHEYAHAYQNVSNWGGEATMNIWRSYTELNSEFSLSQLWAVAGSGSGLQTVEAGWQVYPNRHLSSHPSDAHLFIYSTQDGYNNTGCYDLDCDDFVQTNSDVAIGGYFTNHSVVNGTQYVTKIMALKDHTTGHWWIKVGDVYAGYYPRSLYNSSGLRDKATKIDFGGEIVNTWPSGRHTRTDMGSGYQPSAGYKYAAYQRTIRYIDLNYAYHTPSLTESRTKSACYDIDSAYDSGTWKTYFYFGGEGYGTGCP